MATQKTFTAHDLSKDQPINIFQVGGGVIRFSQGYQFLDENADVIESLGNRDHSVEVNFGTLPTAVQTALLGIQDYLYQQALLIEGMGD